MTESGKLLLAVLASYTQTALSILAGVILPPLLLATVGKTSYGTLLVVAAFVAYAGLSDLGFAYTAQRALAGHYVHREWNAINRRVSDALVFYGAVAIALCVVGTSLSPRVGSLLRLTEAAETGLVRDLFLVCLLGVVVRLFSNLVEATLVAFQAQHVANALSLAGSFLGLTGAILALLLGRGIVAYCGLISVVPPATILVGAFYLRRVAPQLRLARPRLDGPAAMFSSVKPPLFVFLLQVNSLIAFSGDNLIIGMLLGPSALVPYSLVYRVTSMSMQITNSVATNLFPVVARLNAEGQKEGLAALHWTNVKLAACAASFLGIFMVAFGEWIIRAWTGPGNFAGVGVTLTLAMWLVLLCTLHPTISILMLRHNERGLGILGLVSAVANVLLSFVLVRRIGVLGTALATLAVTAVNATFILRWQQQFTGRPPARYVLGALRAILPAALLVAAGVALVRPVVASRLETASRADTLLHLAALFMLLGALHVVAAWRLSLSASEREVLGRRLLMFRRAKRA